MQAFMTLKRWLQGSNFSSEGRLSFFCNFFEKLPLHTNNYLNELTAQIAYPVGCNSIKFEHENTLTPTVLFCK